MKASHVKLRRVSGDCWPLHSQQPILSLWLKLNGSEKPLLKTCFRSPNNAYALEITVRQIDRIPNYQLITIAWCGYAAWLGHVSSVCCFFFCISNSSHFLLFVSTFVSTSLRNQSCSHIKTRSRKTSAINKCRWGPDRFYWPLIYLSHELMTNLSYDYYNFLTHFIAPIE